MFIDADNVYWDARRAFHRGSGPTSLGQTDPGKLARLVARRGPPDVVRELTEVRAYTGLPSQLHEPVSHAARARQLHRWRAAGVTVADRPLRYPNDWPRSKAEQKGVDVALAVDVVSGAARRRFDVAVIASTDTDLVPALEAVIDLRRAWGSPSVEVIAWAPLNKRLRVAAANIWCHWLTPADYLAVRDPTNYAR